VEITSDIKYQINLLEKSNHFSIECLKFYEQVLTVQQNYKERINKPLLSILARTTDLDKRLIDGRPLIDDTNFYVDPQVAQPLLQELLDLLERWQPSDQIDEIKELKSAMEHHTFDLTALLKNFVLEKKDYFVALAESINAKLERLFVIARTIDLPLLEVHRDILRPNSIAAVSDWLRPFCPTCGSPPAMGRLEKEVGQRFLWCMVCNSQWQFPRLQCPFCLNADQTKLRYFFTDEASPYRVDVCDNCQRFLKTVDERKLEAERKAVMNVEDLLSLSLDELAKKEGYQNALWWLEIGNE
jgi:formate dehydrogenase accessory protein FdhE